MWVTTEDTRMWGNADLEGTVQASKRWIIKLVSGRDMLVTTWIRAIQRLVIAP